MRKGIKKFWAGVMAAAMIVTLASPTTAWAKTEYKLSKQVDYFTVTDAAGKPTGSVEKCIVNTYTYTKQGNLLKDKSVYYRKGEICRTCSYAYSYDKKQRMTKEVKKIDNKLTEITTAKYSKNKAVYKVADADKKLLSTTTVKFKGKKITGVVIKNAKGTVTRKIAYKNNKKIKEERFRENGGKESVIKYNSYEDEISHVYYDYDGETIARDEKIKNTYKNKVKSKEENSILQYYNYEVDGEEVHEEKKFKSVKTFYTDGYRKSNIKDYKWLEYDDNEKKWITSFTETYKYKADKSKKRVAKRESYMDGVLSSRTTYEYKKVNVK